MTAMQLASRVVVCALAVAGPVLSSACDRSPTSPSDSPSSVFTYSSAGGDPIGGGQSRHYTTANATIRGVAYPSSGLLEVTVTSADRQEWWTLQMQAPRAGALVAGHYEPVVAWRTANAAEAQLRFTGMGRGCSPVSGAFTLHQVQYGSLGELDRLHATFRQTCAGFPAGLSGEVVLVDGGTR